ncbi:FG-nucleoporin NUP1 SKDI_15G2480 [Saccharomyces kudriavzevii IFO 1802]|uniref:NUP1-like protein n=1 Tax=Saccharomyces kudriavzevii (strain ATCC MYA-4449 / AS 2.2408 / CBS 8840 / NBRC 1802 / NCYC 2889) TaxID=226230 RepID=A0AA35J9K4_SACK1|nr:uncharacterized protein SKDI_15G2480 [Saccharomyces kudriavzevii IFO 1802]CAI4051512.1 hypothetical protein SKDI_15G2480 [Saccharomyces kudriavzevii IFO 1802]
MTASTSSVLSSPREGKRSFSSTIKLFFTNSNKKRPFTKKVFDSDFPYANHLEEPDVGNRLHVKKRKRISGTSQQNTRLLQDNNTAPIIIYGAEDTERPPVLPILPIQRLRLLREKQKLRNIRELRSLQSSKSRSIPSSMILDSHGNTDDKDSYIRTSSTPSPIKKFPCAEQFTEGDSKNITAGLPVLRSLKNRANRERFEAQSKGTVWSANFEYDLSEYDALQEQNSNSNDIDTGNDQTTNANEKNNKNNDVSGNLAVNPEASSGVEGLNMDINSNRLSSSQKNLLLNGSTFTVTKSPAIPTLKKISDPKKIKESVVLPTIGFDFIKDNETPSKKTSPITDPSMDSVFKSSSTIPEAVTLTKSVHTPKLSFNLGQNASEVKATANATPPSTLFNFGGKSDTVSSVNKPFTFGNPSEEDKKPGKPQVLAFSSSKSETMSGTAPKSTAPAFTFGKHKKNNERVGEDGDDDNEPRRKRRAPVSEVTNAKPLFSLGDASNQEKDKNVETKKTASEKPSFAFSPVDEQAERGPSFMSGKEAEETNKMEPPQAFTFGKPASVKESGTKPSESSLAFEKPTFTFGQSAGVSKTTEANTKSVFSFNKPAEETKSGSTSNAGVKPLFTFSSKPAGGQPLADGASKPTSTFSFTKPAQKDSSAVSEAKNPSFTFETSASSSQQKPLFSFGTGSDAAKEPAGPKTSFSFAKPSAEKADEKATSPSFMFNAPATNHIAGSNTKPSFSFGASELVKPSAATVAGSGEKTSGGFSFTKFDDKKEKSATPTSFFKGSASTTPVSVLGKPAVSTANTISKSAFSLGAANIEAANVAPSSKSFSFNTLGSGNNAITTNKNNNNNTTGTNVAGKFNFGKPPQNESISTSTNGGGPGFNFSRPGTATNSITSDPSSFNFGGNDVADLNPFTSAPASNNAGLLNKPTSMSTQSASATPAFNFTGNNSAPSTSSVFNMNNNSGSNTVFGGSNTNLPQQSQNSSFNTNNSFTPSTVPNMNFGGFNGGIANSAAGVVKPTDIFGGNAPSGLNVNVMNPSSVFGGAGGTPSFGQVHSVSNQMGMVMNNGTSVGTNAVASGVMANRKIARMRHSKR